MTPNDREAFDKWFSEQKWLGYSNVAWLAWQAGVAAARAEMAPSANIAQIGKEVCNVATCEQSLCMQTNRCHYEHYQGPIAAPIAPSEPPAAPAGASDWIDGWADGWNACADYVERALSSPAPTAAPSRHDQLTTDSARALASAFGEREHGEEYQIAQKVSEWPSRVEQTPYEADHQEAVMQSDNPKRHSTHSLERSSPMNKQLILNDIARAVEAHDQRNDASAAALNAAFGNDDASVQPATLGWVEPEAHYQEVHESIAASAPAAQQPNTELAEELERLRAENASLKEQLAVVRENFTRETARLRSYIR